MSMNIVSKLENGFLLVRVSGDFTLDGARSSFLDVLTTLKSCRARKVIFDCLQLKGAPSMMEYFKYSEFVASELSASGNAIEPQIAYVGIAPLIDKDKFAEARAASRTEKAESFDSMEAALGWLCIGSTNRVAVKRTSPSYVHLHLAPELIFQA